MFFGYLDKIKTIKIGKSGFEAETRELNNLIGKAKDTITELQELGKLVGDVTTTLQTLNYSRKINLKVQ